MRKNKLLLIIVISIIVIAGVFSQFASSYPDGLERVVEDMGLVKWTKENILSAPINDYKVVGIKSEGMSTGLAGIIGLGITFSTVYVLGKIISKRNLRKE